MNVIPFPDRRARAARDRAIARQALRHLRELLADRIQADIAALDLIDGCPDLEPDGLDELAGQPIGIRGGSHA